MVYWMQRAQRAVDNPALETAIAAASALGKPAPLYSGLLTGAPGANLRQDRFMTKGLRGPLRTVDADVIVPSRLSDWLDHAGRHEMVEVIEDYVRGLLPHVAPLTMVRHYVRRFA